MHRDSESEISRSESKCLELRFLNKRIPEPVYTGIAIKGEGGQCLKVALVDRCTGNVVKTGPEASAQVEIHAIDESFDKTTEEDWTPNEFNAKILEGRRGKLTGDRRIQLQEGIGSVDEIHFSHTSAPFPKTKLILGAKVVNLSEGVRIREAKTESFTVKDRREMSKKDRRLSPSDEVWRLVNIGKGGSFHEKLLAARIHTVRDFLNEYERNLETLKIVLGKTMSTGKFEATVKHARTCTPDAGVMPKSVGEGSCSGLEDNHASRDYPPYANEMPTIGNSSNPPAAVIFNGSKSSTADTYHNGTGQPWSDSNLDSVDPIPHDFDFENYYLVRSPPHTTLEYSQRRWKIVFTAARWISIRRIVLLKK